MVCRRGRWKDAAFALGLGCAVALFATSAAAGPAIDQFEVKDLESAPGDFEFQSQNAFSTGQPRRRFVESPPGNFIYDDNTVTRQRESLEVELGVTDWFRFRIGIEYEQERLDEPALLADARSFGALKLDEVSLETVFVFVKPKAEGVGLGWLIEYGSDVADGVEGRNELVTGPIVEAHSGPWAFIANLALVKYFNGRAAPGDAEYVVDHKIDFAYFLQGSYRISPQWKLALEGYGTIDRLGSTGSRPPADALLGDSNQHRAGPVLYYTMYPFGPAPATASASQEEADGDDKQWSLTIGSGILFGLNDNTPDETYKLSIELDY